MTEQRDEAITVVQAIIHREGADLESLAPRFYAERFVELLEAAGFDIIRRQGLAAPHHVDPER
jgi:hypothetical protein